MKKLFLIFLLLCLCCKNEPLVDPRIWGEALERELSFRKEMQGQVGNPVKDPERSRGEQSRREGCGKWIKPKATLGMDVIDGSIVRTYTFEYESWNKIDSVWVSSPEEADVETVWTHANIKKECGEWKYRWVKQECMRSLDLSGIQTLEYREPDTCWQQERYWDSTSKPDTCGFWKCTKWLTVTTFHIYSTTVSLTPDG